MKRLLIVIGLLLSASAWAQTPHTFVYTPDRSADRVVVAGSFNGWSQTAHPMQRRPDDSYAAVVDLPDGVHHYKFVVDGAWTNDPKHSDPDFEQSDGHGGMNSAVFIGFDGRELPAPKPNHIRADALRPDRQVVSGDELILTLRTQANDVDTAYVLLGDEQTPHRMQKIDTAVGFDHYQAFVRPGADEAVYLFRIVDGDETVYLTAEGPRDAPAAAFAVAMDPAFVTPDWARDAVWYQIFPERFRNGDSANDPEPVQRWQADWWSTLPGERAGADQFYHGHGNVWRRRFGGDLQGVREALPYLQRLGVNAIYFNPVFEAESMHKYDTTDLRHIDDNFGVKGDLPLEGETEDPATWRWSESDKLFLDFIEEAHRQGFRVVIDGVFNHVGTQHPFFQDVLKHGERSKYADWFEITSWGEGGAPGTPTGIQWDAWDGPNGSLPAFKKDPQLGLAPGPREHVMAVTQRWLAPDGDPSRGVDGWRLDAPQEINHRFWRDWRTVVKQTKPDALIIGEIWSRADPYLQGDQYDAVMNYQFGMPAIEFFANRAQPSSPSQFARALNRVVYGYPLQASMVMMNLYDSHDTDRVASMFVNPDRPYDGLNRLQNDDDYSDRKPNELERRRMRQALAMKYAFVGAPMIYYGTEAGMWSPDDPNNRQPMVWRDHEPYDDPRLAFDAELFAYYQRLAAVRHGVEPLRRGAFRVVQTDDDRGVLAFARDGEQSVYVLINRGPNAVSVKIPVDADELVDVLHPTVADVAIDEGRPRLVIRDDAPRLPANDGAVRLTLPAYGTAILVPSEAAR